MERIKTELKWALIFMLMLMLWMLLERLAGLHDKDKYLYLHPIITMFVLIPSFLIYFLALREKRRKYYHGKMTYGQGFVTGLIMSLFISILTPFAQLISHNFISPHYFSNAIAFSVEHGYLQQADAEQYFNSRAYLVQSTMMAPIMGIIITSIVAAFTVKK